MQISTEMLSELQGALSHSKLPCTCNVHIIMIIISLVPRPSTLPLKSERKKAGEEGLVQSVQKGYSMSMAYWEW